MRKPHRVIFNLLSILFLSFLIIFYGYRFVHFYILEHKTYENEIVMLYEKLIDNKGIDGTNVGLQSKDGMYVFAPNSDDNYLYYAGRLWRIISINENNNIKLITNDSQTLLAWDNDTLFIDSNINNWLNKKEDEYSGLFEISLKNSNNLMKQNNLVASLLTKEEYESIGENNYLKTNFPFWITDSEGNSLYIGTDGKINENEDNSKHYVVRPTIVLKNDVLYISGTGKKDEPYIISDENPEKAKDLYVGQYLKYSNLIWKIIDVNENVKVVLDESLDEEKIFSKNNNICSTKDGICLELNNDFYDSLENKDYIIPSLFYIGGYGMQGKYDYKTKYDEEIELNVGMLEIGDFFINEDNNIFTLTKYSNTEKTIFTINKNGSLYADYADSLHKIKPVLYLDGELFVVAGVGTIDEPYEVVR